MSHESLVINPKIFATSNSNVKYWSLRDLSSHSTHQLVVDNEVLRRRLILPYITTGNTLISGVQREDVFQRYLNLFDRGKELKYGSVHRDPLTHFYGLKHLLLEETRAYVGQSKSVGLLLTGGMDSRVAAGVLREIQMETGNTFRVTAITWGHEYSRDVVYARNIALRLKWEHQYIPISPETLEENFYTSADEGAEIAAFHYHAVNECTAFTEFDVILAASYGDSVGRGEYSGQHISTLSSSLFQVADKFGLLNERDFRFDSVSRADALHKELFLQSYYMGRNLQPVFNLIAKKTKFQQVFTSSEILKFMLSATAECRTDDWYVCLLQNLPGKLLDFPWARTGKLFKRNDAKKADDFARENHQYSIWLRTKFSKLVDDALRSESIKEIEFIDLQHLQNIWAFCKQNHTKSVSFFDEVFCFLISFKIARESYGIAYLSDCKSKNKNPSRIYPMRLGKIIKPVVYEKARILRDKFQ